MSKVLEVLHIIDDVITRKLTDFCWWTDKHFKKNNVFWAKFTAICVFPLSSGVLEYLFNSYTLNNKILSNFIIGSSIIFVFVYIFSNVASAIQEFINNALISPNKNRSNREALFLKVAMPISGIVSGPIFEMMFPDYLPGLIWITVINFELVLYFLCTEPLPPSMKKQSSEKYEII